MTDRTCRIFVLALFVFTRFSAPAVAQIEKTTVSYFSEDSLEITADLYIAGDTLPYVVLLHEQESSRGEFADITARFAKMYFNCLVPDLRNGGNANFVSNETARRARMEVRSRKASAIEGDIKASVDYAYAKSGKQVILLGAGANGSLALKSGKELEKVKAVIALSPGEYFLANFSIEDTIKGMEKRVLVTSSQAELPYVSQLVSGIATQYKTVFAPENSEGFRGTEALLPGNSTEGGYWWSILLFFKDL